MRKHALVCNLRYKLDNFGTRGELVGLLKYVQYRDDRDQHIPQHDGIERWHDHGLGDNYRTIFNRSARLAKDRANKDNVLVRMLVVSPHPNLVAALPRRKRHRALRDLTETMMEQYFEANDLPLPEYSYVIHDPQTEDGTQRLHSHVFFPATVPALEGRQHYDLRRKQMPLFHHVRDQSITHVWTDLLGPEQVAELDAGLLTEAEKRQAAERDAQIVATEGDIHDLDRWFGLNR